MTKLDLLQKANKGYPAGTLAEFYDPDTGTLLENPRCDDYLGRFIVTELSLMYDSTAPEHLQIEEAIEAMFKAQDSLIKVAKAIIR